MPRFSVIVPVYRTDLAFLTAAVDSVRGQHFEDWELVIADDASGDELLATVLVAIEKSDDRIRVVRRTTNGGISAASNSALEAATGEFVALLDHDDLLTPDALEAMSAAIDADPDADYLYSDEEKMFTGPGEDLHFFDAFRRPEWSPERLRGQMYAGHLSVLRRSLVTEVGGFDHRFDGSQDHDLVLRVTERARRIVHVPRILYRWRVSENSTAASPDAKSYTWDAGVAAVDAHLSRVGIQGRAERGPLPNTVRIRRALPSDLRVSVVIPTNGSSGVVHGRRRVFVVEAVRSLLARAGHDDLELVVVWDTGMDERVLEELRGIAGERLVLVEYTQPFNFSDKCNVGFLESTGGIVVMLNDDVEIIAEDFLVELCAPLVEPDVGMTGALTYYEDGTIQHAGHRYADETWGHTGHGADPSSTGHMGALVVNREAVGVTAACAAIRREVFAEVGAFTTELPGNFNDVDLSNKIRRAGYRILWLPAARLWHFESRTRVPRVHAWEVRVILDRWGLPGRDPYQAEPSVYGPIGPDDPLARPHVLWPFHTPGL